MDVEVRAFGGMEIAHGPVTVRIGSRQRQMLLATLVLHRGSVVPVATLAERMWPAGPPDAGAVANRLRVHIHRLRQAFGDAGAVLHHPPGYALAVSPDRIDVHRFEDLVRLGRIARRRGDHAGAADLLRQAVALCRGPAFQGLDDMDDLAVEAHRLAELRLTALEDRTDAELALGEHTALVAELEALVTEHPLRERFRAQLMTAMHRAGRRGDALRVYRQGWQILVDELGVEPNEECQAVVRAILGGGPVDDPAGPAPPDASRRAGVPVPVPRQLPADVAGFTGRSHLLRELDATLAGAGAGPAVISAVDGMAGVGKTALAVRWAHRVAYRFPDGQFYADLRGYAAGPPLPTIRVLAHFLLDLGVPAAQVPADLDQAAARYRSMLADRRMLVVLDNAATAEQVRPLLPGGGTCAVVVTSRDQLAGLVARDGARGLTVDVLTPTESMELLTAVLGTARVAAEPELVAELAELCGHLPLALRIAAASLATHPVRPIAGYVARLRDGDRLAALVAAGDEPTAVAAAFGLSYQRLAAPARWMFRLLGLVPDLDLAVGAAAALGGTTPKRAEQLLDALAGAHLLDERVAGRYSRHDLVRRYAAGRAGAEDPAPDRAAALARLYQHYLHATCAAARLIHPHALRLPAVRELAAVAGDAAGFTDRTGALGWLDAERANLAAVLTGAAADGSYRIAWLLTDALRDFLVQAMDTVDGVALAEAGLAAAVADGQPHGQAAALLSLAGLEVRQGRFEPAAGLGRRALALLADGSWLDGRGVALSMLGTVCSQQGKLDEAAGHYRAALTDFERSGWRHGQAGVVGNLGLVLHDLGRLAPAAEHAARAAEVFAEIGSTSGEAISLVNLGDIRHLQGKLDEALDCYRRAEDRYRAVGDHSEVGRALCGQAMVHTDAGRASQALPLAESAVALAQDGRNRTLEPYCLAALATVQLRLEDRITAVGTWQRAAALAGEIADQFTEASAAIGLATAYRQAGRAAAARAEVARALTRARNAGYRHLEAQALSAGAAILLAQGMPDAAATQGEQALAIHRETGHRLGEARIHLILGHAQQAAGVRGAAVVHWRRAQALASDIGLPEAEQAAAMLAG